jgi:large subunit ribosomal protein L19
MSDAILAKVQAKHLKTDVPRIEVGDNVDVHTRIVEGEKERIQIFSGVVMAKRGGGISQTITVRRIVANEGVERTFPVHSPKVARIEVTRHGHARRAKLYYLRDRIGKSRRLRDRRRGLAHFEGEGAGSEGAAASAQS